MLLLSRIQVIIIEFITSDHSMEPGLSYLVGPIFKGLLESLLIVHLHPNKLLRFDRARCLEFRGFMKFTFLRKDRVSLPRSSSSIPHPAGLWTTHPAQLVLPGCWWRRRYNRLHPCR